MWKLSSRTAILLGEHPSSPSLLCCQLWCWDCQSSCTRFPPCCQRHSHHALQKAQRVLIVKILEIEPRVRILWLTNRIVSDHVIFFVCFVKIILTCWNRPFAFDFSVWSSGYTLWPGIRNNETYSKFWILFEIRPFTWRLECQHWKMRT